MKKATHNIKGIFDNNFTPTTIVFHDINSEFAGEEFLNKSRDSEVNSISKEESELILIKEQIPNNSHNVEKNASFQIIYDNNQLKINKKDTQPISIKNLIEFKYFYCNFENCHKKYRSRENLKLHDKNVHQNVKPYQCRFCDSAFSHRNG